MGRRPAKQCGQATCKRISAAVQVLHLDLEVHDRPGVVDAEDELQQRYDRDAVMIIPHMCMLTSTAAAVYIRAYTRVIVDAD